MERMAVDIRYFLYSQAFADGFRTSFAILLPALLGFYIGQFETGLTISLGAMCVSLTDAPGPPIHRRAGMILACAFVFLVSLLTPLAARDVYLLAIVIAFAAFFFSMFNVYGNRASSVGNSALLMLILTMDVGILPDRVFSHALLVLAGGVFYSLLSLLLHALQPYRVAQRMLGDCFREMAKYLAIKSDFYDPAKDLDANYRSLVAQQVVVNDKQEAVREVLFKSRQILQESTPEGRRLVLAFVEAVDLFEDITAAYYDYSMLREQFRDTRALELINETLSKATGEVYAIGLAVQSNAMFAPTFDYDKELDALRIAIEKSVPGSHPHELVLRKILVNIRQLFNDIRDVAQYFRSDVATRPARLDSSRFVSQQQFDVKTFLSNLTLRSYVFRHALRVSIACLVGFIVAKLIAYGHHSYWILLTIAFILKPAFSLTKQRNIQRIIGTLAGGAIGAAILFLTPDKTVHFAFLVVFMIGTYSFMRIRYLVMVICITPYILILFSFLGGEFRNIAEERLLDTGIGSAIAFAASYMLFPTWEATQLKGNMLAMVRANAAYLQKATEALTGVRIDMLEYKLARKDVYVSSGNLAAAFQRMLSEPKSKQQHEKEIHQFVVLNHILFSNTANLAAMVLPNQPSVHSGALVATGRKAINKLNQCRTKLGDKDLPALPSAAIGVPKKDQDEEDVLLKEQLNFIYRLTQDLEKTTSAITG